MYTTRIKKEKKLNPKKDKLRKLITNSDSEENDSEHELSYYVNDRVKLMKEVLKIIKPKKIRSMAPTCMKNLDNEEINSMLLEELLGISNKRLKYIFNGQNLDEDSSSTDPEDDQKPIDVISLDDISDDDFVIDINSDTDSGKKYCKKHRMKIKEEITKKKKIKKEKHVKDYIQQKSKKLEHDTSEQNLMSVLELLELQARARAIRSQLVLENNKKVQEYGKLMNTENNEQSDDDIIVESPKNEEIIITSSDSENGGNESVEKDLTQKQDIVEKSKEVDDNVDKENTQDQIVTTPASKTEEKNSHGDLPTVQRKCRRKHRYKLNRSKVNIGSEDNTEIDASSTNAPENTVSVTNNVSTADDKSSKVDALDKEKVTKDVKRSLDEGDGIVLNVDRLEMECIYLD